MNVISEYTAKITNNPIGAVAGGGVAFFVAKKFGKLTNIWALIGIAIGGVVLGAYGQSKIKAKAGSPNAQMTK